MDNQKFRVNLTIYHTNGGVMSPTTRGHRSDRKTESGA